MQEVTLGLLSRSTDSIASRIQDAKPYIEIKGAILVRSGIYTYTRQEILKRGHKPTNNKAFYREYRTPASVIEAKDMFRFLPVVKEHIPGQINSENFGELTSAMTGDTVEVVTLEGGDIALKGNIAFFTKDAYDYYMAGNRETSPDYVGRTALVEDPDKMGFDLMLTKFESVNNLAITAHGRGGKSVRVCDSAPQLSINEIIGRKSMGILGIELGFGKLDKSFSAHVRDSLEKVRGEKDAEKISVEHDSIMACIDGFSASPEKEALISVVKDSFAYADKILSDKNSWKKAERLMDGLYTRCTDSEAALAAKINDSMPKEDDETDDKGGKKDGGADDKGGKKAGEKDSADAVIAAAKDSANALIDEKIDAFRKELPGLFAASMKDVLGLTGDVHARSKDSGVLPEDIGDASFIFGTGKRG